MSPRLLALALLAACSSGPVIIREEPDAGSAPDAGLVPDAGSPADAGDSHCAGTRLDEGGHCVTSTGGAAPVECCAPYDCDATKVGCRAMTPACGPSERPSVVGTCWGPCVPAALCAPPPPATVLCANTGGTWHDDSCGHWRCGMPPECAALIPGCDCGPERIFDDERGCVASDSCLAGNGESCGGHTRHPRRCGPGLTCDPGEGGPVDAPGTCVPDPSYTCDADNPCGRGVLCCYPCGIPGCRNTCMAPGPGGDCPAMP